MGMFDSLLDNTLPTAVVPIFVNAGTAILPAIVAPLAAALALIFKPRELIRVSRRRPMLIPAIVVGGIGIVLRASWLLTPETPVKAAPGPQRIDWAKVALDILREEELGGPTTNPTTKPTNTSRE